MVDHRALVAVLSTFASALAGRYEPADVLEQLCQETRRILDADGVAVALADDGQLRYVTATDEVTRQAELIEEELQTGPCREAFERGDFTSASDLEETLARWPEFGRRVLDLGFRAAAGIPMQAGEQTIGTVNLYQRAPRSWDDEELGAAQSLANVASAYVMNTTTLRDTRELTAQLQHALESRVVIEQAKGVLAERHGIDPPAAFERLRSAARRSGRQLRELATEIVEAGADVPDS